MYPVPMVQRHPLITAASAMAFVGMLIGVAVIWGEASSSEQLEEPLTSNPSLHERFSGSGQFIAAPENLTPCGLAAIGRDASGRFGTLVSDRLVISCAHAPPTGSIAFFASDSPVAPPVWRTIIRQEPWPGGDLSIGVLDHAIPSTQIPPMRMTSAPWGFSRSSYLSRNARLSKALLVGRGDCDPNGHPLAGMRAALGCLLLNESSLLNQPSVPVTGYVPYGTSGEIGKERGADLFHAVHGDSGGPVFIPSPGGQWRLAGIISTSSKEVSKLGLGIESTTGITCISEPFLHWMTARFPGLSPGHDPYETATSPDAAQALR